MTPDGNLAVITFNGGNYFKQNSGQVAVIDLHSQSVVKQISFDPSDNMGPVALSPDGSVAYFPVNSSTGTSVQVYAFSSQSVLKTFSPGAGGGLAIAISPDGSQIELGESGANVLCLDAKAGSVIAQSGTLGELVSTTISSDGSLLFVPNFASSHGAGHRSANRSDRVSNSGQDNATVYVQGLYFSGGVISSVPERAQFPPESELSVLASRSIATVGLHEFICLTKTTGGKHS